MLLVVVAWALGPLILRCAGGLLTICALVLWAMPMGTHTSAVALVFTAVSGAAMWHTGTTWQARRDAARFTGHRTSRRTGTDRTRHRPAAPGENTRRRRTQLDGDQAWNGRHRDRSPPAHADRWDEDIIDGVAYDLEPDRGGGKSGGASNARRRHTTSDGDSHSAKSGAGKRCSTAHAPDTTPCPPGTRERARRRMVHTANRARRRAAE